MAQQRDRENNWRPVRELLREVDPQVLAQEADRPLSLALVARGAGALRQMENFLVPVSLQSRKAAESRRKLALFLVPLHPSERQALASCDLVVCSEAAAREMESDVPQFFVFRPESPEAMVRTILKERGDLAMPLARNFLPFRRLVQRRWIQSVALENTLLAALSAVAEDFPAPLALAKIATSTGHRIEPVSGSIQQKPGAGIGNAFLTANQMRLAFLLAASSDSAVGFQEQRGQITAVAAAALGWQALARGVEQRMPSGSSLWTRGLLAFLGTYTVGLALQQFHVLGQSWTREEKSVAYEQAYRLSRKVLEEVLERMAARARSAA